jgi:mono/diheme cytochrome c family protein
MRPATAGFHQTSAWRERRGSILAAALTFLVLLVPISAQAPNPAPAGNREGGKKLFMDRGCWTCHGTVAQGGGGSGPRLAGQVPPWPAFWKYVRQPTEEMVPFTAKVLPDQELADIYAWLRSIPAPPAVTSIPQLKE